METLILNIKGMSCRLRGALNISQYKHFQIFRLQSKLIWL